PPPRLVLFPYTSLFRSQLQASLPSSPSRIDTDSSASPVQMLEHTPGIVTLDIHQPLAAVIDALRLAVQNVARHPDLKAVLLSGRDRKSTRLNSSHGKNT